jgi:antitoxin component YwqK of YwqJK toxin-antitoxin module
MKKILIIALILLASCASKAKDESHSIVSMQLIDRNGFSETISSKDRLNSHQKTDFARPQPYKKILRVFGKNLEGKSSSKISTYHDNGQLNEYLEVVDGRAHGVFREYYSNGQQKIEGEVIEGVADISDLSKASWHFNGKTTVWEENGTLIAEIFYDRGALQGTSLYYHPNGQLSKSIPYHQNEIEGTYLEYDVDGFPIRKALYIKGLIEGKAEGFWKEGHIAFLEEYEKGLLQSATYYSPSGEKVSEVKEGTGSQAQFQNGQLRTLISYLHGSPEGIVQLFTPDGNLEQSYHIKEGQKNGEELQYYPVKMTEGKLQPKLSLFWQEDALQGVVKTWYKEGAVESQREMDKNKKHGLSFAYYPNGDLMLMEEYDHDQLLRGSYFQKGDKTPKSKVENGNGTVSLFTPEGYFLKKIIYEKGLPL